MEPFISVLLVQVPTSLCQVCLVDLLCVQAPWAGNKVCAIESSLPLCWRTYPEKFIWQTAKELGMHPNLILASPHSSSNFRLVIPYAHPVCCCMEMKEKIDICKQRTVICNLWLIFGLQIGNYLLDNLAFSKSSYCEQLLQLFLTRSSR